MKKPNLLLTLPAVLMMNYSFAQSAKHLQLSDDTPSAREKISLNYNATGTPLEGKSDIKASVYFLDNKKFPVSDVELKKAGNELKGDFIVPANTSDQYG